MKGASPEVHIHIKRIPINEVPNNETEFGPWVHRQFAEKDKYVNFISDKLSVIAYVIHTNKEK